MEKIFPLFKFYCLCCDYIANFLEVKKMVTILALNCIGIRFTKNNNQINKPPNSAKSSSKQVDNSHQNSAFIEFVSPEHSKKKAKKKTLPFEARQTAAAEMFPKALALVRRKKAPALLAELIQTNLNAIKNDADWSAYYRHLEAIGGYLSMPAIIKE